MRTSLDDGYERFPVMFVDDWSELFDNVNITALLHSWLVKLAPYYQEGSALRHQTLHVSHCMIMLIVSCVMCFVSCVSCHVSCVVWCVMCYVLYVVSYEYVLWHVLCNVQCCLVV